ncbi:TolB family protein [Hyphobacterium marinum]|uniref:WD40-like Beta Propeller Repeat n=1 Tax=Hyphobacterium marinum TaxID=3116574 RepID=A0ABU7LZ86_9PROT|nr:hypothetical protein [Hyphobacterium sp. Y6023]MEE2566873.1 hypothetical protein [Hyphobacterium sp. Y6023]
MLVLPLVLSLFASQPEADPVIERVETGMPEGRTFAPSDYHDGTLNVFTFQPPDSLPQLWQRRRGADGAWSAPEPVPFADPAGDADAYFQPGTGRLVFMSLRGNDAPNWDIWEVHWDGFAWGQPRRIDAINGPGPDIYPTVAADGTIAFATVRDGTGADRQIWLARPDGPEGYETAVAPGAINRDPRVSNPLISPDGRRMIVFENLDGGFGGPDLALSCLGDDGWSEPVNLGPGINTAAAEYAPGTSADGRVFYFSRDTDLYRVSVSDLPAIHGCSDQD